MSGSAKSSGIKPWQLTLVVALIGLIGALAAAYTPLRTQQIIIEATLTAEAKGTTSADQATNTAMSATAIYLTAAAPPTEQLVVETPSVIPKITLPVPTSTPISTSTPQPTYTPVPSIDIQVIGVIPPGENHYPCTQGESISLTLPIDIEHTFFVENGENLRWKSDFNGFLDTNDPASHTGQAVVYSFPPSGPRVDIITIFRGDEDDYFCELEIYPESDE